MEISDQDGKSEKLIITSTLESSLKKAIELFENQDYISSVKLLSELINKQPEYSEAYHYRALAFAKLLRYKESITDFQKALNIVPDNARIYSDRALVFHFMGEQQKSLADFDKAAALEPDNPYRYSSRAFIKDRWGDLQGAMIDYEKAIALDPEDAISINNKGMLEEKLGYQQQAKKSFERADELNGILEKSGISTPNKNPSQVPPIREKHKIDEANPSVNAATYFKVLKGVFSKKSEFQAFIKYCKGLFLNSPK